MNFFLIHERQRTGMGAPNPVIPNPFGSGQLSTWEQQALQANADYYSQLEYLPGGTGNLLTITEAPKYPTKSDDFIKKYWPLLAGGVGLVLFAMMSGGRK